MRDRIQLDSGIRVSTSFRQKTPLSIANPLRPSPFFFSRLPSQRKRDLIRLAVILLRLRDIHFTLNHATLLSRLRPISHFKFGIENNIYAMLMVRRNVSRVGHLLNPLRAKVQYGGYNFKIKGEQTAQSI